MNKRLKEQLNTITELNQAEALRVEQMGFKLHRPAELSASFETDTEAHALDLVKRLKSLGLTESHISSGRDRWQIISQFKMPIATFISPRFAEKLAIALVDTHCTFQGWQKQYIL
jgi:DNA replication protein DnaD